MSKKSKEQDINLYYWENEKNKKIEEINKRRKSQEREIRIEEKKQQELDDEFDFDNETVIGMTNKNKIKMEEQKRREFSKKQRKKNKLIKKIKKVVKVIIFLGIIIGGIIFATCSPIFNIKEIEVINNNKISSEEIISLSGINKDENIFKFITMKSINSIKQNPYVEDVKIKRVLPNKIQIDVVEREAKYAIPILSEYAYINSQGYILEIAANELNLPIINGLTTEEEKIKSGNRLEEADLTTLETILKIMASMQEYEINSKVTSINVEDKKDYIVYMQEEKKNIHLGDGTNLSNKMLYVVAILEEEKGIEGDIYVDGDINSNFKVYFKEKI